MPTQRPFTHITSRDADERYIIVIRNGDLKVFDLLTGAIKAVTFTDGKTYLDNTSGEQPEQVFRAVTIADTTIINNRTITPAMDSTTSAAQDFTAFGWVNRGDYGVSYNLKVEGTSFTYTTSTTDVADLSTPSIVEELRLLLVDGVTGLNAASVGGFTDWEVSSENSALVIKKTDGADFKIEFFDDRGNNNMTIFTGQAERVSELPLIAPKDIIVQITGLPDEDVDEYYVKFVIDDTTLDLGLGHWVETRATEIEYQFDPDTMPYTLARDSDNNFEFRRSTWGERVAGDTTSSPDPSFIGKAIKDVLFYKNRLGFLADENVIFSRAGDFFEFFPATVQQLEDDSPIDVSVSHSKVSILDGSATLDNSLILFSDQGQFKLVGEPLLTPSSVSITPTTTFEANLNAQPVEIGDRVFFSTARGTNFSGVVEYFVKQDGDTHTAQEVTSHVPSYIPGTITSLDGSTNENIVVALTPDEPASIFVYKYYFGANGFDKLQSSWSKWTFGVDAVLSVNFIDSVLYMLVRRGDDYDLEFINIYRETNETGTGAVHLDGLHPTTLPDGSESTLELDLVSTTLTVTSPYPTVSGVSYVLYDPAGTGDEIALTHTPGSTSLTATGILVEPDDETYKLGAKYEFLYEFSTLYPQERFPTGGQAGVVDGRLQLSKLLLNYAGTEYIKATVTPDEIRSAYTYELDLDAVEEGTATFPLLCRNLDASIVLTSDEPTPLAIQSATWEGRYYSHTRRI